jgi:HEAT repeat protein
LREEGGGRMRRVAAQGLRTYGEKAQPAVPALLAMLDRDTDRAVALETLRAIHVHDIPPLLAALNHKDANVRAFACESLGELGPEAKDAVPVLEQKAQGDSEPVRGAAKKALQRIQANTTTPSAPAPAQ